MPHACQGASHGASCRAASHAAMQPSAGSIEQVSRCPLDEQNPKETQHSGYYNIKRGSGRIF